METGFELISGVGLNRLVRMLEDDGLKGASADVLKDIKQKLLQCLKDAADECPQAAPQKGAKTSGCPAGYPPETWSSIKGAAANTFLV